MEFLEQDGSNCSIGRTVEIVGQPWTLLILRGLFRGVGRFEDLQSHLGVSRSVLTKRLDVLLEQGLIERQAYREPGQRARSEYVLTPKGNDLYPIITALRQFGDQYLTDPEGPASTITHSGCGAPVHVQLICDHGHVITDPADVIRRPGPGARRLAA
jgi:DNA-binding HxlR family transcriptional regulator